MIRFRCHTMPNADGNPNRTKYEENYFKAKSLSEAHKKVAKQYGPKGFFYEIEEIPNEEKLT